MTSRAKTCIVLTWLSLCKANIVINTATPSANKCLKPNHNTSSQQEPLVVNNFLLPKCCEFGWHLDLSIDAEKSPCVKGNQSAVIDMVRLTDKKALLYEPIQLLNHSIYISSVVKGLVYTETDGRIILNENGNLRDMDDKCAVMELNTTFCVDYNAVSGAIVGLWTVDVTDVSHFRRHFNVEKYVLVPSMATSILCLIVVIAVYWWVAPLKDLTGMALIGLACCMVVLYTFFILQYTDVMQDNTFIERMEDIAYMCSGIWFILLWGSICANAWYYLPRNKTLCRRQEWVVVITTSLLCTVISIVALSTEKLPTKFAMLIVVLIILVVCFAACFASWVGFSNLRRHQERAYLDLRSPKSHPVSERQLRTFNATGIKKCRTMCTCSSYILFYAILCYTLKCASEKLTPVHELFNALAGFFVFLVFVCWRRSRKIIENIWCSYRMEPMSLNETNAELMPGTNLNL